MIVSVQSEIEIRSTNQSLERKLVKSTMGELAHDFYEAVKKHSAADEKVEDQEDDSKVTVSAGG